MTSLGVPQKRHSSLSCHPFHPDYGGAINNWSMENSDGKPGAEYRGGCQVSIKAGVFACTYSASGIGEILNNNGLIYLGKNHHLRGQVNYGQYQSFQQSMI
jgi:hypothetical protein